MQGFTLISKVIHLGNGASLKFAHIRIHIRVCSYPKINHMNVNKFM